MNVDENDGDQNVNHGTTRRANPRQTTAILPTLRLATQATTSQPSPTQVLRASCLAD